MSSAATPSQVALNVVSVQDKEKPSQEATTSLAVLRAENAETASKSEVTKCTIFLVESAFRIFNAFYTSTPTHGPPCEQASDLSSEPESPVA